MNTTGSTCPLCGFPEECDCQRAGRGGCELTGEGEDTMCACCAIDDDAPDCCQSRA